MVRVMFPNLCPVVLSPLNLPVPTKCHFERSKESGFLFSAPTLRRCVVFSFSLVLFSHFETYVTQVEPINPCPSRQPPALHPLFALSPSTPAAFFNSSTSLPVKARNLPGSKSKTKGPNRTLRIFS